MGIEIPGQGFIKAVCEVAQAAVLVDRYQAPYRGVPRLMTPESIESYQRVAFNTLREKVDFLFQNYSEEVQTDTSVAQLKTEKNNE